MTSLWPIEDERSALAGAFDEAAKSVNSDCALVVLQRKGESVPELEARARSEAAADKLGRHLIVVRFVAARDGRPAPFGRGPKGDGEPGDQPL